MSLSSSSPLRVLLFLVGSFLLIHPAKDTFRDRSNSSCPRNCSYDWLKDSAWVSFGISQARAAEGSATGVEVGLFAGAGIVNGLTSLTFGIGGGVRFASRFYGGLTYNGIGLGVPAGVLLGYEATGALTSILVEAQYRFLDFLKGFNVGVKFGLVSTEATLVGPLLNEVGGGTNFSYGAAFGYQFPLGSGFALTPEINVILVSAAEITLINAMARISYQF